MGILREVMVYIPRQNLKFADKPPKEGYFGPADTKKLSKDLKAYRDTKGISQAKLALFLKIPVKNIENWEQKFSFPSASSRRLLEMRCKITFRKGL